MARGPKQHLKRLFAPKDWMLSKLGGVFAPRPKSGPHKLRESLPLLVILRNRLRYALNGKEAEMILKQRLVKVDGRTRTNTKYPAGFMDVIEIPKSGERFRIMYDVKGRFTLVKIGEAEGSLKLCKVTNVYTATHRIPVVATHDGRRIRYADPLISRGDTIVLNTAENKIVDFVKRKAGKLAMITGGANRGRVGTIESVERHPGSFDIMHIKDAEGNTFATRGANVFALGNDLSSIPVTLPKLAGVRPDPCVEREERLQAAETRKARK
jgi:small subunit ribosomal protein S4e